MCVCSTHLFPAYPGYPLVEQPRLEEGLVLAGAYHSAHVVRGAKDPLQSTGECCSQINKIGIANSTLPEPAGAGLWPGPVFNRRLRNADR